MRSRVLLVLLALTLGSLSLLTSCANSGDRVGVLGDSITSFDTVDLQDQLGDQFRFTISGNFGKTTEEVRPQAEVMARLTYDQLIVNLGTNDVLDGLSPQHAVEVISAEVELFDSARCVHVVTVNEHMTDQRTGRSTTDAARQFNDALRAYAQGQDRVDVIDWNAAAADHLDESDSSTSTLTSDSIHPTPEGNRVLNDLYATALGDCVEVP